MSSMSINKRLIPIVVESNSMKQGYLHQAIRAEPSFMKLRCFSNIDGTIKYLRSSDPVDVVLISSTYSQYVINHFVSAAKESKGGKEAAYVLFTPMEVDSRESIANSMIDGMDGVLFSPFSVHSVEEVALIATQVRKKFELQRKKAALFLLLPNVTKAIDDLAFALTQGMSTIPAKKKLVSTLDKIAPLKKDFASDYYTSLFSLLEEAPPRFIDPVSYSGASKRLRKKLNKS
jgi:response regulator RpfG family c-di-GMP phosphodiesterase